MKKSLPKNWEIDSEDLGNVFGRARIQSCNACVSTSMALCCWPCNCYEKESKIEADLMWDLDLYARLDRADAWAIIGPINWYGPSSNLKLMFDRLVCASGGNPREDLIEHKNPEMAMRLEKTKLWEDLSQNHLEGRTAGFFCYGDGGANEIDAVGRPKKLRHKNYFDVLNEPFENGRDSYAPLVWQCRYSGIEVPDNLWTFCEFGRGKPYGENQSEDMIRESEVITDFDIWVKTFSNFVEHKGKVKPSLYRAAGYEAPSHKWADLKLKWRDYQMRFGNPPKGSSPQKQQELGLNEDQTLHPRRGENESQS